MFRCQFSKELSQPGEKAVRVVIEARQKTYFRDPETKLQVAGAGWEIVREIYVRESNLQAVKAKYNLDGFFARLYASQIENRTDSSRVTSA